ncbi:coiled-coil and C2 domain-containing protein 2A-like [Apostichopus japonicus]|uniref:coiled-coil and C2 domain-containing protein 2A-like n=1 Tax=Stichopus japonicus TaxID=307972 RepID=UPI003AB27DB9
MSADTTLVRKLRDRRRVMKDSTMEMTYEDSTVENIDDGTERMEELQHAEDLIKKLTVDREERRRELSVALEPMEEPPPVARPRKARRKQQESSRVPVTGDEDEIPTIPTLPDTEEDDDVRETAALVEKPTKTSKKTPKLAEAALRVTGKDSTNLNASIQERIKKRIMEAKQKAEQSLKEEVQRDPDKDLPGRRLRGLRARDLATRFDEPSLLTKEEIEEDKKLQESIAAKSKWKAAFKAVRRKESDIPTAEEAYDFFTQTFEPVPPATETAGPSTSAEPEGEEAAVETQEDAGGKILAAHFIDSDDYLLFPSEMKGAEYLPLRVREENEEGFYFVPELKPVPAEDKVPGNVHPRYLEDEGFYVGVRPEVSARNQYAMENRLLRRPDKGSAWFGEDGLIKVSPDPLKDIPTRPHIPTNEERETSLQTIFMKAILADPDQGYFSSLRSIDASYQLDVDVNTLVFTHHSLFSKEHVLASSLTQMYDQYLKRKQRDMAKYLSEKLGALKQAARSLQMQLERDVSEAVMEDLRQSCRSYKYEIRETRRIRDHEMLRDRTLLKNILKTWKRIKAVRTEETCTNTPLKLSVRREETSKAEDEEIWRRCLEEETVEIQEDYEEEYEKRMGQYKTALREWKEYLKNKKKKRKKKQGSQENLTGDENEEDDDENEEEPVAKPLKPEYEFLENEVRESVRQKMLKNRRRPGEPFITPELNNTAIITPTHECPRQEQQRRADVQKCRCFIKVFVNGKEVSKTSVRSLSSDFTIHFGNIFNVQVVQWPESIALQVHETGVTGNICLADLFLPVPDTQVTSGKALLEEIEFSSDHKVTFDHSAVGSGVPFKVGEEGQHQTSLTSGYLLSSASWGLAEDNTPLIPPVMNLDNNAVNTVKHIDAIAALGATGVGDLKQLMAWAEKAKLDPNDPSNTFLLHALKQDGSHNYVAPDYYRLEQFQQEFDFVNEEEIEKSKRFKLLELRAKEIQEFRGYSLVPCNDKEIPDNVFVEYEKRLKQEEEGAVDENMDPHRVAISKFLAKVRQQVVNRYRASKHTFSLSDVVDEALVPDVSLLGATLAKLTEPKRPLKPVRKERKTVTAQNLSGLDVFILVNIERAFEIPDRKSENRRGQASGEERQSLVRPFIEVVFQGTVKQTSVAEGCSPNFNEELALPFRAPNNDYSSQNLETVQEDIYFNVFDEYVVDILRDDRERGSNVHQRLERRWLGSVRIPFSTVYFQGRVSGAVKVESPTVLLGYQRSAESVDRGVSNATYLSLFITIEPPLTTPDPQKEKVESREDEKLLAFAENFTLQVLKKFPKREVKTTVVDINGTSVFITRYFRPLKPPEALLGSEPSQTTKNVAKFVSLVPFLSDNVSFPGICDIWSSCDQFLQMLQGDEEEHAVLLVNYFMHLGKTAYLVLGTAIPEGPTSYVLSKEGNEFWVWNPTTGEKYQQTNNFCPLKSVGCLVNQENIWANIQVNAEPSRIDFDVSKTSNWKPLFTKSFPNPGLSSIQPPELVYHETDAEFVAELQDKIEKKLRDCVMDWRTRHITRWNRYCTQIFRQILKKLEHNESTGHDYSNDLQQVLESYSLCGFPLHMPYTDMKSVIERVRSTGVHLTESPDTEFALAVHIHPYPCNVLSVWVYIASLTRKL